MHTLCVGLLMLLVVQGDKFAVAPVTELQQGVLLDSFTGFLMV